MNLTMVVGARPNFMKVAPIIRAIEALNKKQKDNPIAFRLIHTGQHYDTRLSQAFFDELNIPHPDKNLGVGSGTHASQTAAIMVKFEQELTLYPPNLVLVVGDVTSTMACTIAAKKLNIDVAHVEAGIRSGDKTMPEELNRMVTDAICDHFFTTTILAGKNLINEGKDPRCIHLVGNTMIDTLLANKGRFRQPELWKRHKLKRKKYIVLTLHRPTNVDKEQQLYSLLDEIIKCARGLPVIFPVHPRTAKVLARLRIDTSDIIFSQPLGYLEFNYLVKNAKAVITDSGGITEETTVMGVPCLTLRDSTERPETITIGTNELIGSNPSGLAKPMKKILSGKWKKGGVPRLWDGKTAKRIVDKISGLYKKHNNVWDRSHTT